MRRRPSSRLLVLDPELNLLLFRFVHRSGALAGQDFWATPGGGVEPGESFADAARRELKEETGLVAADLGEPITGREFVMTLPDGEQVIAEERFFVVHAAGRAISRDAWTELEVQVMAEHRWWSAAELAATTAVVWPDDLPRILHEAGDWPALPG